MPKISKKQKRGLPGSSCEPCKKQHRGCDGERPCGRCVRNNRVDLCKFGIAPESKRGRRRSHRSSNSQSPESQPLSKSVVSVPSPRPPLEYFPSDQETDGTDDNEEVSPLMIEERDMLRDELTQLTLKLSNLQEKYVNLQRHAKKGCSASDDDKSEDNKIVDKAFLSDIIWNPPVTPSHDTSVKEKRDQGKLMTLSKEDRIVVKRKEFSKTLEGSIEGYSETDLASLNFSKDLLTFFGGDCLSVNLGQHAQCICYNSMVVYANQELKQLMRANEDVTGRCVDDFVPPGLIPYHHYLFNSQLLNSGSSTIAFHTVLCRLDGTYFQCVLGLSFLKNARDMLVQKLWTVYLNTVKDIPISPYPTPLPFKNVEFLRGILYEPVPAMKSEDVELDESLFPSYYIFGVQEAQRRMKNNISSKEEKY